MIHFPYRNCVQDPIHVGTKLRNRLLRPSGFMPMGSKQVSVAHLKILIKEVPKGFHGLVSSDICPLDRQNFASLKKCMDLRTRNCLKHHVPDSEATIFYLQLCSEITSSYMEHDLMPLTRLELIFHAVYFLRIWRKWVMSSPYNLNYNFISRNSYMCVEVNAESLLNLIKHFRDVGKPQLFLPTLFSSQGCENAFRQFRAMGTVNWTKINFTLLELLHMIGRFEVQSDILYNKLAGLDIVLPKLQSKMASHQTIIYPLPSNEDIEQSLRRAKRFALDDASKFGIKIDPVDIDICEQLVPRNQDADEDLNDHYSDSDEDDDYFINEDSSSEYSDTFCEDADILDEVNEDKAYVTMVDHLGHEKLMRKSQIVWLLTEDKKKYSSDRLVRVQDTKQNVNTIGKLRNHLQEAGSKEKVVASKQITIGDWCFFKHHIGTENLIYIGVILAFKYANGRTEKEKSYKKEFVDLNEISDLSELEALSSWYSITQNARLIPAHKDNHKFISLENYIATALIKPTTDPDTKTLHYNINDFKEIDSAILNLI